MNEPSADEVLVLQTPMGPRQAVVRTPARLAKYPTLLIALAGPIHACLDDPDYCVVSDILLAAGHRVASFDLPNHGQRVNAHGKNLSGMAAAIAAGEDVFADIRCTGQALIDQAIQQKWTHADDILLMGISRGGLSAMHIMAADPRVGAAAVISTVTDLPTLHEFANLRDHPIIQQSNAQALLEPLSDRWLFGAIGQTDPRVNADLAIDFFHQLQARGKSRFPSLYVGPGQSHGSTFDQHLAYQAAAAFLLDRHAQIARPDSLLPLATP